MRVGAGAPHSAHAGEAGAEEVSAFVAEMCGQSSLEIEAILVTSNKCLKMPVRITPTTGNDKEERLELIKMSDARVCRLSLSSVKLGSQNYPKSICVRRCG